MSSKALYIVGTVLVLAFAGFAMASFTETLTPYVDYAQARSAERQVQVAGGLAAGSSDYDNDAHALRFTLEDEETAETLAVRYEGVKPANFEEAISIVAIGRWNEASQEFDADKLLVKCPSKYQGLEEKEYG